MEDLSSKNKNKKKNSSADFIGNPMISKLEKVKEFDTTNSASYAGVAFKTFVFLLFTALGVVVYFLNPFDISHNIITYIVLLVLGILCPILTWVIRPLTPVLGAVYSVAQGYLLTATSALYEEKYKNISFYAIAITLIIIISMLILYATGIIKVGKKFRTAVFTLMLVSVFGALGLLGSSFIWPDNFVLKMVYTNGNPISILLAIVGVLIAAAFLAVDFDDIKQLVEKKLSKEYEWQAAFSLVITVFWLYLKVLSLLARTSSSD